jgi:hypothetical protein
VTIVVYRVAHAIHEMGWMCRNAEKTRGMENTENVGSCAEKHGESLDSRVSVTSMMDWVEQRYGTLRQYLRHKRCPA